MLPTKVPVTSPSPEIAPAAVTGPLPVPAHALSFDVRMSDGAVLATDVYLPHGDAQNLPTILTRLPYDKCGRYTFLPRLADRFTAHGFAVAVQDVRGKFRSQGGRQPFVHEASDGASTLDWICAQPWSNGAVGMYGDSYYGFTQWAAASTGHPALKAIVPRVTGSDLYTQIRSNLVPQIPLYEWVVHTWAEANLREEPYAVPRPQPHYFIPEENQHVREVIEQLVSRNDDGSFDELVFPEGNPAERLRIPALHMGGWFDNILEHQLRDWARVVSSPAAQHQFLRVHAVDHEDFPWRERGVPLDNQETDEDALVRYLDRRLPEPIAFLDHYLNDRGGRWRAPTVWFETTNGPAQTADRWPPARSEDHELVLTGVGQALEHGGRLLRLGREEVGSLEGTATWVHDPRNPVPYLIANEFAQCEDLPDEAPLQDRPDVLTFDSDPVRTRIDIVGTVRLTATVDATTASTHLIARLLDLYPDGQARFIAEGAARVDTSAGFSQVTVTMRETAYRLRPGHAMRLAVSTSCFPLYAVHPGHDGDVWDTSDLKPAPQRLLSSTDQPCVLTVSVLEN